MKQTTDKRIVAGPSGLAIPDSLLDGREDAETIRTALRWVNAILGHGSLPPVQDLPSLDAQRLYVLRSRMQACLCPACHSGEPPVMASNDFLTALSDAPTPDDAYTCRRCGEGLTYVLPFVGNHRWHLTAAAERRRLQEGK